MKKINIYLFVIAFTLGFSKVSSQDNKAVTYQNYTKAKQIFDKLIQKNKYDIIDSLSYSLSGVWHYLGHYSLPKKREPAEIKEKISIQGMNNLNLKGEVLLSGNKYNKEVHYYNNSLSLRNYGKTNSITNFVDIKEQDDLILLSPITLINDIRKNIKTLRYIGYSKKDTCEILTYSSFLGKQVAFYVRNRSYILKAEILDYDNMNGDYITEYLYQNYTSIKDFLLPSKITIKEWGAKKKELNYEYQEITEKKKICCTDYELKKIDTNFYTITLPTKQNRIFVIDFGKYLGIIEAPISNRHSAYIHKVLQNKFPKKEIKYLFLTHHHPDHAGGFDYFLKRGVTIVTTEINKEYFEELSTRNHTIENNFLSESKKGNFEIVPINGIKKIKAKNQSIFIYEFGKSSIHTDEYLLYYLPQQKSLIIGDLWKVPQKGVYGSKRASNIGSLIEQKGITVKHIYQTWPLQNMKEVANINELQQSILLNQKK